MKRADIRRIMNWCSNQDEYSVPVKDFENGTGLSIEDVPLEGVTMSENEDGDTMIPLRDIRNGAKILMKESI